MTTNAHITDPPEPPALSQVGRRGEAREVYRQSLAAEMPLTGKTLGEMFGRSDRWGRERITEVPTQQATGTPTAVLENSETTPDSGKPVPESGTAPSPVPPPRVPATARPVPAPSPERLSRASVEGAGLVVQPRGARAVVWTAFLLGITASLAANVAHATPSLGPRLAAGFVPLALLLAVECMTRPMWNREGWLWGLARYGGTGLVAIVAAIMSYRHMHGLLLTYGEDPFTAALGPLAIDGLMIVAGFALLATAPAQRQVGGDRP